jgi:hypothetical protein
MSKHGVPTCKDPTDPTKIYMRNMYHEFFWGPFDDESAVIEALKTLDVADSYWDYDPFCMIYGADPLPKDYVFGFESVPKETRVRIETQRNNNDRNRESK